MKIAQFISLVLVLLAATYGAQHYLNAQTRDQNHYLCVNSNAGRAVSNKRIRSEIVVRDTLAVFAKNASAARYAAWKREHQTSDLTAARQYAAAAKKLESVPFPSLSPLKCPT